ncbi:uncharacterized protein LOC128221155 [Mya arenaria]|uniref:uncharacterized protein LOC128221155 n=1 Tax=Mya arenaria TaxID=6604 RepID=UPI0022E3DEA9|nr:uncharacterized protein LOC128221155 [Mya arenaria]
MRINMCFAWLDVALVLITIRPNVCAQSMTSAVDVNHLKVCSGYEKTSTCFDEPGCSKMYMEQFVCNGTTFPELGGKLCPNLCGCCSMTTPITATTATTSAMCRSFSGLCQDNGACSIETVKNYICSDPIQAGSYCPRMCNCCV